ncbi:hypothetical protein L1049_027877 [Liquidambar formosana]|uniref:Transmembrane 9 superfamily member n=1 Tax=Liquidambar formosana TaxID=63359 RepID=A0AAP0RJJ5_LIQFO
MNRTNSVATRRDRRNAHRGAQGSVGGAKRRRGSHVRSDASDHRYKSGDQVPLYANKVGPFHNPSETYRYFDLPFCLPDHLKEKKEALGEVLNGDRLVSAPYKLGFLKDKDSEVVCNKKLSKEEVAKFRAAVNKDYYFQMYYDDLPIWGFIGKVDKEGKADPSEYKYFLYKHIHFDILYNKDRVIEINVRTDPNALADLTEDKEVNVEFMYTVKWKETNTPFENRMDKYSQSSSLPHHLEIHWFSIINSCVTVLLLTGFLATILMRVLKNDFVKYAHDEESAEDQEETGWKYIHGDVFRYPKHKSLFAAALGSGTQLFTLTVFIFILALVGVFYPYNRGALFTALVVIYALTSGIAGYTATSFYCQLEGANWVRNLLLTGCLFCGPLFLTFCFLNTVAIAYNATAALPFGTIVVIVLIWTLVTSPLLVLGGIAGKNSKAEFQAPCRTTKYPREIPPLPWYRGTLPQMAMAGFLPFSAIYIELYYIFASVWGHRIYTIYSILFIVFIILLIVTAFITVALTYFQLAAEDHEWWWRSFLCGGSTGLFIYGYCLYYYYARSDMSGFMQTSFFFGYMACICYGFFLMLGIVGFRAALLFVRHIYRSIKCAYDPELRPVLELATDSELYELERILFGPSYFSPLLKSIASRADVDYVAIEEDLEEREDFITLLESRFLFLAADARSTLRGWRPSYRNVLLGVRKELKIPCSSKLSTEDLEVEIFLHLLRDYSSEESGICPSSCEKSKDSNSHGGLEFGLSRWKVEGVAALKVGAAEIQSVILKGGGMFTLGKIYQLLARRLSGKMLLEAANYQIRNEVFRKGGQLAAINLESRAALLAARQGLTGAASRYLGLKSMMALLGPMMWGTFLADVVIQMLGTDYARILRAIYAFAQIRITRTYRLPSDDNQVL